MVVNKTYLYIDCPEYVQYVNDIQNKKEKNKKDETFF